MKNKIDILHPLWVEINLDNLSYNMKQIANRVPYSNIIGIVKCNAYGHGAIEISREFNELGIKTLAVANISEAIELRNNDINCNIMTLGISLESSISSILKYDIQPAVSSLSFAESLNKAAKDMNKICNIHIALDTGMGRIGFRKSNSSIEDLKKISCLSNINIISSFSHFSTADYSDKTYSNEQLDTYDWFFKKSLEQNFSLGAKNISNSAAIIDMPDASFNYVRPGIIEYGYYPSNEVCKNNIDIKPVLTWKSKIVHIKEVDTGCSIGYGRNFIAKRKSTIATIPVGYGDGYSRLFSNKGFVIINDNKVPIVGNVCMDQIMVDITGLNDINVEDEVILLGRSENIKFDADDFAEILGTINYEPLCLIGRRSPRIYIKNNEIYKIVEQY